MKNIENIIATASKAMQQVQKTIEPIGKFLIKMADTLSSYHINFSGLYEVVSDLSYIDLLKRIKLPLFLIDDKQLKDDISSCCQKEDDTIAATKIMLNYCSEKFINKLKENWNDVPFIKRERLGILNEALTLHTEKRYYASTTILMCQIFGIGADILAISNEKGLEVDDETYGIMQEYFGCETKSKKRTEKWNLVSMTTLTDSGFLVWNAVAEYLANDILVSGSVEDYQLETQPLRNKICHGEQLNYNTEEHSIKAILTIDILIQLANCIYMIDTKEKE